MIYIRAYFYARLLPLAIRRRWAITILADVADVLMQEAAELGPEGRPWIAYLQSLERA
jgi:hypothetical protein